MTDQRGTIGVFRTDQPDSRGPVQPVPQPVSDIDVIGAHITLGQQDFAGAEQGAEVAAYGPIVTAITRDPTSWWGERGVDRYVQPGGASPVNRQAVWEEVERRRRLDPSFLADVKARNADEFSKLVQADEAKRRRAAQGVIARQSGLRQNVLGFGADVGTGLFDPFNLLTLPVGGELFGASKSVISVVAREALANAIVETVDLPIIAQNRAGFGEEFSASEMVQEVATAGVGGAAFAGAAKAAGKIGGYIGGKIADGPIGAAARRAASPIALKLAALEPVSDADVAAEFARTHAPDTWTPDERAAYHVVTRDSEIAAANPFVATPGARDAFGEKMQAAIEAVRSASAARTGGDVPRETMPDVPRTRSGGEPLTQDAIIRFTLNDLEGGAAIVNFSDADGGTTKFGIAQKFNPGVDVASLTEAQAAAIARQKYWLPEFNRAPPPVAAVAFDAGYIGGPKLARRIIAEAGDDAGKAIDIYRAHLNHLADTVPGKAKFRKGWNNRVDKLARRIGDDAAGTRVMLDAAAFPDEAIWRAAQAAIDAEELALHADTPARADPIGDYVDRYEAGAIGADDRAAADFAVANREAIDAEIARRQREEFANAPAPPAARETGRETPRETGGDVPRETIPGGGAESAPARTMRLADTVLAAKSYVANRRNSLRTDKMAAALGISESDAHAALEMLSNAPNATIRMTKARRVPRIGADGRPVYRQRGSQRVRETELRPARFRRASVFSGDDDIVRFLLKHGGLRDDEGHDLRGRGYHKLMAPGMGPLLRRDGMSLDEARGLAESADFFIDTGHRGDGLAQSTTDDLADLLERAARGERVLPLTAREAELRPDLDEAREQVFEALIHEDPHLAALDGDTLAEIASLIVDHGFSREAAVLEVAQREIVVAADLAYQAHGDPDYAFRPDPDITDRTGAGPLADWPREGEDGYDAFARYAAEGIERDQALRGGAAADESEAAGLAGPVPTDTPHGGIVDPDGPEAAAIADSIVHDIEAALDLGPRTDPALAARNRQAAQIAADGPPQLKGDQEATIGTPLFDAIDQGGFRLDDAGERSARDIFDEIDRDQAAIDALKGCINPKAGDA